MPKKPPDLQAELKRQLKLEMERRETSEKMAECAQEAKRLHDAGDLKGARKSLKQAEQWREKMEAIEASTRRK